MNTDAPKLYYLICKINRLWLPKFFSIVFVPVKDKVKSQKYCLPRSLKNLKHRISKFELENGLNDIL